jgi:hypothetical protein
VIIRQREVRGMATAKVTPYGMWTNATFGEVDGSRGKDKNIPVVFIPICPANPTINKSEFPSGLVILNDCPKPFNSETIELDEQRVASGTNQLQINIGHNVAWPSGTVVLWD